MNTVEKSIVVNVPVRTAYDQWTQFEEFPQFMEGIEKVRQEGDSHTHWHANIAGQEVQWDADITEQTPDQRVSWRSTSGAHNAGTVSFQSQGADRTNVTLRLEYEPEGFFQTVGSALGFVDSRVEGDLERFKTFIESRGQETGAWRGEIHGSQVEDKG
ncbi:MAG: SRPBCC family protein [Acidobacteria bacterium]|nr:SRPBCC family protein [Acidobacteriota bacterium]MCA1639405.1 SRPBCC family protein [Acidobacteriota bacterium]